jgi:hypothetical protein
MACYYFLTPSAAGLNAALRQGHDSGTTQNNKGKNIKKGIPRCERGCCPGSLLWGLGVIGRQTNRRLPFSVIQLFCQPA